MAVEAFFFFVNFTFQLVLQLLRLTRCSVGYIDHFPNSVVLY